MQPINRDLFPSQLPVSHLPDSQLSAGVRVSGNTISWLSEGWHEVQYASSGNTVSEGGQSASVGPGTYNVINHTTGERFENIVVGQDTNSIVPSLEALQSRSLLDVFKDQPSTTDKLLGSTSNGTTDTNGDAAQLTTDDPRPQVPETIYDGNTSIQPEPGQNLGDIKEDAVSVGLVAGTGAVVTSAVRGAPPPVAFTVGGITFLFSAAGMIVGRTDLVTEPGSIPNEMVNQTSKFDEDAKVTTTIQDYQDGTQIQRTVDHNNGSIVTTHQDASKSITRTVSTKDVDTANSPRTEVTTHPSGRQVTVAISPTGGRYVVEDAITEVPTVEVPTKTTRTSGGSGTTDSQNGGGGSKGGGLSSGTGNQTSNNPHTA